jgi:hypothetical protein
MDGYRRKLKLLYFSDPVYYDEKIDPQDYVAGAIPRTFLINAFMRATGSIQPGAYRKSLDVDYSGSDYFCYIALKRKDNTWDIVEKTQTGCWETETYFDLLESAVSSKVVDNYMDRYGEAAVGEDSVMWLAKDSLKTIASGFPWLGRKL